MIMQLIFDANKAGTLKDNINFYFDLAEQIEEEAFKRKLIRKNVCDKCGIQIKTIDLKGQFRIACDCKDGIGETENKAYIDWLNK